MAVDLAGARVAQLAPATITDPLIRLLSERGEVADDYLEFRDTVETAASAMAAMRANDVDLDRIRACAERIERAHVTACLLYTSPSPRDS